MAEPRSQVITSAIDTVGPTSAPPISGFSMEMERTGPIDSISDRLKAWVSLSVGAGSGTTSNSF